jgi:flagellar basal body-associated protein FliL
MSKLKIILPVLLIALGGVYKFVLAKPPVVPKPKIAGEVYVLPKEFLVNLKGGHFAKINVALILEHGHHSAPAAGGHGAAPTPPTGYGVMPQEAVVRSIITDELTDVPMAKLQKDHAREELQEKILKRLHKTTDTHVEHVLFTDVAIQ